MLIRLVPHLDPEGEVARNVVQVRIGQLPKQLIHSEIRFRASTPQALRCLAQLFKYGQGVELAVTFVHENIMRTKLR